MILQFTLGLSCLIGTVFCRKQAKVDPYEHLDSEQRLWHIVFVVGTMFSLILAPAIIIFIYNVFKDPMSYEVGRLILQKFKDKAFSNLSQSQNNNPEPARPPVQNTNDQYLRYRK